MGKHPKRHTLSHEGMAAKVGGFAANFACGFFEFRRVGTRSRIFHLEHFAKCSLILSDVNTFQGVPFWVFSQLLGCYLKPIVWYFTTQLALNNIRVIGKTPKKAHLDSCVLIQVIDYLARLSKFFGFLRFSSPRAVKTPAGAPKGRPKP